jgi:hypothetical protein
MHHFRRLILMTGILLFLYDFPSQVSAEAPNRDDLLKSDKRLSQKITFTQRQTRIGEVFDAVEKQTGVHLTVEDRDGAAGEIISVFVRDQSVADLMTSVWSLVSFQRGEWRWIVTKNVQNQSLSEYRLMRPTTAREYPIFVNAEIKKYFEELMEANIRASRTSKLSPEDAAKFPEAIFSITDNRIRLEQRAFAALCLPEERLQLLRGETTREIASNNWPPEAQAYIDNEVAVHQADIDSHPEWRVQFPTLKARKPEKITIRSDDISGKLTPNLWLGSFPVVGSTATEKLWQDKIAALWLLPGDTRNDPTKESVKFLMVEPNSKTWFTPEGPEQAVTRLKQLHEQTGVAVLARLTGATLQVPQPSTKTVTLGDAIANLRERKVLLK